MTSIWRNTLTLVGATTLTFGMAHAQSPELSDPPEIEGEGVVRFWSSAPTAASLLTFSLTVS